MADVFDSLRRIEDIEDIEASLLKTGSAFMLLSVGENGVFGRIVDPETLQR